MKVPSLILIVSSFFVTFVKSIDTTTKLTTAFSETRTTSNAVPIEFPKLGQNYTFLYNSSIRENLENHTSHTDTEVDDLLGRDTTIPIKKSTTPKSIPYEMPPEPSEVEEDLFKKNLTEWLDEKMENTEDKKLVVNIAEAVKNQSVADNSDNFPLDGNVAAVLAISFLVISVVCYMALMSWRRYLENRYGSRTMLVNEDFNDDDMKHFSI